MRNISSIPLLALILIVLFRGPSALAQSSSTDVRYVWGPDRTTFASVGGGIDMGGFLHAYGGYAVRLKDRGETYYFAGLKVYPIVSDLARLHAGPIYTLGSTTAESDWQLVVGVEFFREFVLFADAYLDAGGLTPSSTAVGFRLPIVR
jgi:hypothetical protein